MKALQAMVGEGNVDIVRLRLLIDVGADVNARDVSGGSTFAAARNKAL